MDILSQIVPSVNFFVATIAKRLQEYKKNLSTFPKQQTSLSYLIYF